MGGIVTAIVRSRWCIVVWLLALAIIVASAVNFNILYATHGAAQSKLRKQPYEFFKLVYVPSQLESTWAQNLKEWQDKACRTLATQHYNEFQQLIDAVQAQTDAASSSSTNRHAAMSAYARRLQEIKPLLSRTEYVDQQTGELVHTVYIEPLAGLLRDPRPVCWDSKWPGSTEMPVKTLQPAEKDIQSKLLLLDPSAVEVWRSQRGSLPAKAVLFDIGATVWGDPTHPADMPGLRWLVPTYAAIGVEFDHIYCWEAKPVTPLFWDGMPVEVRKAVHFYNMPASAEPGHVDNPWTTLQAAVTSADYVVVKLDMDTVSAERQLVEQLLSNPGLSALVDEFYFEHHVDVPEMRPWWSVHVTDGQLTDSYSIFSRLRHMGIRAHSWP